MQGCHSRRARRGASACWLPQVWAAFPAHFLCGVVLFVVRSAFAPLAATTRARQSTLGPAQHRLCAPAVGHTATAQLWQTVFVSLCIMFREGACGYTRIVYRCDGMGFQGGGCCRVSLVSVRVRPVWISRAPVRLLLPLITSLAPILCPHTPPPLSRAIPHLASRGACQIFISNGVCCGCGCDACSWRL